jgi:transcriptional regulator with PAS, ATPase and Fis domain
LPTQDNRSFESEIAFSERTLILDMLRKHHWHKGKTASALDINRTTLWRKMKKYNLDPNSRNQDAD